MKRFVTALAVVSLSMVGCGGSLCDDFASSLGGIEEKVEDCPSFADSGFEEPTDAEKEQCEESLDSCSENDKKILETFISCVDKLDKCVASSEQAFALSLLGCAAPLENVSDACGASASSQSSVIAKGLSYSKAR